MKKTTKKLSLNKTTISNLSTAEMSGMLGGMAIAKPRSVKDVLTCQRSCDPTIHPTLSYLPCPTKL